MIKRADRHQCGRQVYRLHFGDVRGKTASGEETGDKPFLVLVQENDAIRSAITPSLMFPPPQYLQLRSRSRTSAMSAIGTKRTSVCARQMSAFDPKADIRPPCRDIPWQLVNIVVQLAMQSFMNLFQPRNLIFCARACFLQPDHFLRPSSSAIRDFSAPLSTKGAGEKTEGGVCANAVPPTRTTVMAKTASALNGRFTVPRNRRSADIQFPRVCTS